MFLSFAFNILRLRLPETTPYVEFKEPRRWLPQRLKLVEQDLSYYRKCIQCKTLYATVFLRGLATSLTFPCQLKQAVPSAMARR